MKRTAMAWCAWIGLAAMMLGGCASPNSGATTSKGEPQNVILVTLDGMRWQEVFGGLDPIYVTKEAGGVGSPEAVARLKKSFARDSAEASRAAIMPFFWNVVAKQGQVFGDRGVKNVGRVTNPYKFSYPGYQELLCGYPDPRINKNEYPPNPNVTVLEWLNGLPEFKGRVAAYGAWTRLHEIVNDGRAGFPTFAGWQSIRPANGAKLSERELVLNDLLARTTKLWVDEPPDSIVQEAALEYVRRHKPRVFYVSLGETDEWAHMRRYDLYLESANRADQFIQRLWETVQAMPEYAGKTSLVITTDHGRGGTPKDWTDHGAKVAGAEGWWAAVMGPRVPAKGVIGEGEETQGQIAATVAGLVGQNYRTFQPKAAAELDVLPRNALSSAQAQR